MRSGDGDRERRSPYLPTRYLLDESDPFAVLHREDGSEAAVYSPTGADAKEIERAAWEDYRQRRGG